MSASVLRHVENRSSYQLTVPSLAGLNNLSVGDGPVSGGDPAGPGHPHRGGAR
jgi:hypothetical protein